MERGFAGPQGAGMGWESIPRHAGQGGNGARQNYAGRGRRLHPLGPPRPIAISKFQCAINAEPEFYVQFIVHIHSNHNIWNKTKIFCTFMKLFRKEIRASFSLAQYCFIIETTWQFVILKDSYPSLQNIFLNQFKEHCNRESKINKN